MTRRVVGASGERREGGPKRCGDDVRGWSKREMGAVGAGDWRRFSVVLSLALQGLRVRNGGGWLLLSGARNGAKLAVSDCALR